MLLTSKTSERDNAIENVLAELERDMMAYYSRIESAEFIELEAPTFQAFSEKVGAIEPAVTAAEGLKVMQRFDEIREAMQTAYVKPFEENKRRWEKAFERFAAWSETRSMPAGEQTYGRFIAETQPEKYAAWQARRNGPHCADEQVFLDAMASATKPGERGCARDDLRAEIIRLMSEQPAFAGKDLGLEATRIIGEHML